MRWLRRLLLAGAVLYLSTLGWVIYATDQVLEKTGDGKHLPQGEGTALILGSGIRGDGVLAYTARRRVALGVRLLKEGKVGHLVASGGMAQYYPAEAGAAMATYAVELGADPARVSAENAARTTFENILYSKAQVEADGREITVIVSDATHVPRAEALAWALGLPDAEIAAVATPSTVSAEAGAVPYLREALSWWLNVGRVIAWRLNGREWPL